MPKTGNSLKKWRWETYLWTETRIHCTWQHKLVRFINDKQTEKREGKRRGSYVLLRQCWAPVHLAPAHRPRRQRLPLCPGRPGPITDEFRLIQLIPPPSVDTSCLLAPFLWSSVAEVVGVFAFCTASLKSNWRTRMRRRRELCSLSLFLWKYPLP